jgi:hypothetical protein
MLMKFVVTLLSLLLTTVTSSQFATLEWSANFNDWACYVTRSAGPLKVGNVNNVEIIITFYTPRNVDERQPGRPEVTARPVVLQIQILPPFPDWYVLKEDRLSVAVLNDDLAIPLARDATAGAEARPGFVVDGDTAAQVWSKLKKGQGMELLIQYAEDQSASFRVASAQVAIAAAMMESCIKESRRGHRE